MNSSRWMSRSLCATTSLVFAGCMAPGPYSYGTYPGYYAPPPGYAAPPGGAIMAPGPSFPAPQLGPGVNPTPAWQPSPSPTLAPSLSPTPSLGPSSPPSTLPGGSTFNDGPPPFGGSSARKPADIQVPLPTDRDRDLGPAPMAPAGPSPKAGSGASPFGSDGSQGTFEKGAQLVIPQRPDVPVQAVATVDPQTFENPIERERHDRDELVAVSAKAGPDAPILKGNDPCDYDRVKYSWLRGIVDFEQRDKSWHIIYSHHPDRHDPYGGAIRLVDCPKLGTLHSGDVVYIEGRVDTHRLDSRGKAQYVIDGDRITQLSRGPATQSMAN
jgi:hypothetical protein